MEVEEKFLRGHLHELSLKDLWRHSELPLGKRVYVLSTQPVIVI